MAAKRAARPPPPDSSSSEEISSSEGEEEQQVTKPSPSKPQTPKPAEPDSDSDSESESEDKTPKKPVESDESSDEDEEEEKKEPATSGKRFAVKKPESQSHKKKTKIASDSDTNQPNGKPATPNLFQRIWTPADELMLIQAIYESCVSNERLPTVKEYDSILASLKGKLSFHATPKQVTNKVRSWKDSYMAKKKKGSEVTFIKPHEKTIFEFSEKIWGGNNSNITNTASKKDIEPKKETNQNQHNNKGIPKEENVSNMSEDEDSSEEEEDKQETQTTGTQSNGTPTINAVDGGTKVKDGSKYPFLNEVVEEMSESNGSLYLYYKTAFESLDESKAKEYETLFKKHKYKEGLLGLRKMEMVTKFARVLTKQQGE